MTAFELARKIQAGFAPPPEESISEWAEREFRLSPEYSATRGELKLFKFQREPIDTWGDPYTREVVLMTATQLIKTIVQQVLVAWHIARNPGPVLMIRPDEDDAEMFSKERIAPMIRDIKALGAKVAPAKRTSSANTILHKVFDGGSLTIVGSRVPADLAFRSVLAVFGDECDKWPKSVGKEGDPYSLALKRGATFRSRFKSLLACSPTVEGDSMIASAYERSDQRKFFVPCWHCGYEQLILWPRVLWDKSLPREQQPLSAEYHCEQCGRAWSDVQRWSACEEGAWKALAPFSGVAGFWISELYSPWRRMSAIASDFFGVKDIPEKLQTFVNTSLAETWAHKGEAPDWEKLRGRCEDWERGTAPAGVLFITGGIDVQKDRVVVDYWGWGRHKQRWFLDRAVVEGDTSRADVWRALSAEIQRVFPHENGAELPVTKYGIDSGYEAVQVYTWARQQGPARVLVCKGRDSGAALIGLPSAAEVNRRGKMVKAGVRVWPLNVSMAKQELYAQLGQARDEGALPHGYVHLPAWTPDAWIKELVAEHYVTRVVKGFPRGQWENIGGRNEALDCANIARAIASHIGIDRFSDSNWEAFESQLGGANLRALAARQQLVAASPAPVPDTEQRLAPPSVQQPPPIRRSNSGWLGERGRNWFQR